MIFRWKKVFDRKDNASKTFAFKTMFQMTKKSAKLQMIFHVKSSVSELLFKLRYDKAAKIL